MYSYTCLLHVCQTVHIINMQVLSESVAKALPLVVGDEARETARFVEMFDKFFDVLNVSNFTSGIKQRKPFQKPYLNSDDERLEVHVHFIVLCCAGMLITNVF